MFTLLFTLIILNGNPYCDTLKIEAANSNLNISKDSLLMLNVSLANNYKSKFLVRRLKSTYEGEICFAYEWSLLIYNTENKAFYIPPISFCNEKEKPYFVLRKNVEYHSVLVINFKHIYKGNSYYYPIPNHDFGEYEIQLVLKMKGRDSINSNKIKIFYTDQ